MQTAVWSWSILYTNTRKTNKQQPNTSMYNISCYFRHPTEMTYFSILAQERRMMETFPYLLNINEDPQLSWVLKHFIQDGKYTLKSWKQHINSAFCDLTLTYQNCCCTRLLSHVSHDYLIFFLKHLPTFTTFKCAPLVWDQSGLKNYTVRVVSIAKNAKIQWNNKSHATEKEVIRNTQVFCQPFLPWKLLAWKCELLQADDLTLSTFLLTAWTSHSSSAGCALLVFHHWLTECCN